MSILPPAALSRFIWSCRIRLVFVFAVLCCVGCGSSVKQCGRFEFTSSVDQNSTGVAGLFQLDFYHEPSKCASPCTCEKIWFIQILRPIDVNTGEIIQPHPAQQDRMVKDADPAMNGWAVDRIERRKFGYYGMKDDGTLDAPLKSGESMEFGSSTSPARMHDTIARGQLWKGKTVLVQGITIAVCIDETSACKYHVLGMDHWDMNFYDDGRVDAPQHHAAADWETFAAFLAIYEWNNHLGNERVALPFLHFPS